LSVKLSRIVNIQWYWHGCVSIAGGRVLCRREPTTLLPCRLADLPLRL